MPRRILWVDDQIAELRSHIMYLSDKGYEVDGVNNGHDALKILAETEYDAVLLDEMMPGIGGLETLDALKKIRENLPVIMITKSEEEDLMNRAIGQRISDYLVKPVSPLQIVSALKKLLDSTKIVGEQVTRDFTASYMDVSARIGSAATAPDWSSLHDDLVTRELDLIRYGERGLLTSHKEQVVEANSAFARFVRTSYRDWVGGGDGSPLLSPDVFKTWLVPELETGKQVFWIVIDCMRLDQWRFVEDLLEPHFNMERRSYWSILPSATPFARNALFSGLYPSEINRKYPKWWLGASNQQNSKNAYEAELLGENLSRLGLSDEVSYKYYKVYDARDTDNLRKQIGSLENTRLVAAVYNFLDIMAHGRSQSTILKELAPDDAAFRSLMRSWFEHSTLREVLEILARRDRDRDHRSRLHPLRQAVPDPVQQGYQRQRAI